MRDRASRRLVVLDNAENGNFVEEELGIVLALMAEKSLAAVAR